MKSHHRLDFRAIAAALAGDVAALVQHLFPAARRIGPRFVVGSVRGEPGESLSIPVAGEHVGTFKDFSTDEKGDLLKLWSLVRSLPIVEAAREAAAWLGGDPSAATARPAVGPRPPSPPPPPITPPLGEDDVASLSAAALRLADDETLRVRLAAARGWNTATLRAIALEGCLGWEPGPPGRLLFIYPRGAKARWKASGGGRMIRWTVGGPDGHLWRAECLHSDIRTVIVCEGETDAISLVSLGVEADGQTLVVALPSASAPFDAAPLAGQDVVLVPDADAAGERCLVRVARLLRGVAARLRLLPLAALLRIQGKEEAK